VEKSIHSRKGARLRALLIESRLRAHLTQNDVAKQPRKAQSFVSYYEKGLRRLDVVEFLEVAEVLNADPLKIIRQLLEKGPAQRKGPRA
jgi:transcriptional regulator with XRE-family HTH domain